MGSEEPTFALPIDPCLLKSHLTSIVLINGRDSNLVPRHTLRIGPGDFGLCWGLKAAEFFSKNGGFMNDILCGDGYDSWTYLGNPEIKSYRESEFLFLAILGPPGWVGF